MQRGKKVQWLRGQPKLRIIFDLILYLYTGNHRGVASYGSHMEAQYLVLTWRQQVSTSMTLLGQH